MDERKGSLRGPQPSERDPETNWVCLWCSLKDTPGFSGDRAIHCPADQFVECNLLLGARTFTRARPIRGEATLPGGQETKFKVASKAAK